MADLVRSILVKKGPMLSTALSKILIEKHGLSREVARQRISRAKGDIRRQGYVTFPRRAQFLYLKKDFGSPYFWERLIDALMTSNTAYGLALAAVQERGGLCPKPFFTIACGAPHRQAKHLSPETVLQRLKDAQLLEEVEIPGLGICVCLTQGGRDDAHLRYRDTAARLVCESILLKAIRSWIRNLGIGSYEKVTVRDEGASLPMVGTFHWDLGAPSFLGPLAQGNATGGLKPGFVVCDVLLTEEPISRQGIQPFLKKCETLRQLRNVGRCLQIFVAHRYSAPAFELAKKCRIIPATTESLFGEDVANALLALSEILHSAAGQTNPAVFQVLFERLGKIEGAATNLRGALFELVALNLVRLTSYGQPQLILNRIFKAAPDRKAEVDVMAVVNRKWARFVECKGYLANGLVPDEEVRRWLEIRVPLVAAECRKNPETQNAKLIFELWTTGRLSPEAIAMIEEAKAATTKYSLDYLDADDVLELTRVTQEDGLEQVLKDHFLDHPMATAEEAVKRLERRAAREAEYKAAAEFSAFHAYSGTKAPWQRNCVDDDDVHEDDMPF